MAVVRLAMRDAIGRAMARAMVTVLDTLRSKVIEPLQSTPTMQGSQLVARLAEELHATFFE